MHSSTAYVSATPALSSIYSTPSTGKTLKVFSAVHTLEDDAGAAVSLDFRPVFRSCASVSESQRGHADALGNAYKALMHPAGLHAASRVRPI